MKVYRLLAACMAAIGLVVACNDSSVPTTPAAESAPALAAAVTCPAPDLSWYNNHFAPGPSIPYWFTSYVSQGLGYWASRDWLISSHTVDNGATVANRIAVKNRTTGAFIKFLYVQRSNGSPLLGHLGGLSVSANNLWISTVSGTKNLFRIPLGAVSTTANGGSVRANLEDSVAASSYNTYYTTTSGAYLIVGRFSAWPTGTSTMYRYLLSSSESIIGAGTAISTPTQVQGAAVADGWYIFSTSYNQDLNSHLKFKSTTLGNYGCEIVIPAMSEGIVRVPRGAAGYADDWLYVNFESGSTQFPHAKNRTSHFPYALITTLTP